MTEIIATAVASAPSEVNYAPSELELLRAENARLRQQKVIKLAEKAISSFTVEDGRLIVTLPDMDKGSRKLQLTQLQWDTLSLLVTEGYISQSQSMFKNSIKL